MKSSLKVVNSMPSDDTLPQGTAEISHRPDKGGKGNGAPVVASHLVKHYHDFVALDDVSLEVGAGELMTILGPSGSGKTTTMMIIAGFVEGYGGEVRIGGQRVDHLAPNQRGLGIVFQHLELFPHMSVVDNIAFPLRMRGISNKIVRNLVQEALDLVQLPAMGDRLPSQLSGGQRQRVALARAVVFSPPVLLLDEPFGALDKKLRESMQQELKSLNEKLGITVIHVTHDQEEAMAISDRVVVMNGGCIEQIGTPREIYYQPASRFVADFVGVSVFLEGVVSGRMGDRYEIKTDTGMTCAGRALTPLEPGRAVSMMLRPESIRILRPGDQADNRFDGHVRSSSFLGDQIRYDCILQSGQQVTVDISSRNNGEIIPGGQQVHLGWSAEDALLIAT